MCVCVCVCVCMCAHILPMQVKRCTELVIKCMWLTLQNQRSRFHTTQLPTWAWYAQCCQPGSSPAHWSPSPGAEPGNGAGGRKYHSSNVSTRRYDSASYVEQQCQLMALMHWSSKTKLNFFHDAISFTPCCVSS